MNDVQGLYEGDNLVADLEGCMEAIDNQVREIVAGDPSQLAELEACLHFVKAHPEVVTLYCERCRYILALEQIKKFEAMTSEGQAIQ